jgi:hypothetical protein
MEGNALMEGNEFTMFIHGPFPTGIYLDAGKLSSIDDEFLGELVRERKNQIREYCRESIPYMERIIDSIKLVLDDYEEVSNSTKYKFENNTIYFYECGTGLFSTQVTVTFRGAEKGASIASVKGAEKFAQSVVTKKFENQLLTLSNMFSNMFSETVNKKGFSETVNKKGIRKLSWIASDYDHFVVGHLFWHHSVYYFCNPDFFEDNGRLRKQLKENISTDLSFLIGPVPHHEMSSFMDHYGFITDFESGRSIIVTKEIFSQEKINRLVRLLETYQYFYYGLYQLDTFLLKKMYKPNIDFNHQKNSSESIDKKLKILEKKIEQLDERKSSTIRYLEQFRYGSNVLLRTGERSLIEELEKQWDMDRIEKGIRNKLDLFDRELSSTEQALQGKLQEASTDEERYMNQIILVFTVIAVGSLTAQIVDLSPWREGFELDTFFKHTQLWVVLISTGILVGIIFIAYSRKAQRIRKSGRSVASKATSAIHRGPKVESKGSKNPVDGESNGA